MNSPYDVLIRPLITEKSNYLSSKHNKYVFEVPLKATRKDVSDAVEKAFEVHVLKVNTINMPAKVARKGRGRRLAIRKSAYKKAIVTIGADERIPIFEGVE